MLACLLLLQNGEGSEDWNHVRNNYGSRQGHAWRHQLWLEQLKELPPLEEAVGEAGMLMLLPQGAAEEASAQRQAERRHFTGLCRGPGGWTRAGSAPQLRGQSLLEPLAAGCAFLLQSKGLGSGEMQPGKFGPRNRRFGPLSLHVTSYGKPTSPRKGKRVFHGARAQNLEKKINILHQLCCQNAFQMHQPLSWWYLFQSERKQRAANLPSFLSMKVSLSENNISGRHLKYIYSKVSPTLSHE